jgi:hypothetical protein
MPVENWPPKPNASWLAQQIAPQIIHGAIAGSSLAKRLESGLGVARDFAAALLDHAVADDLNQRLLIFEWKTLYGVESLLKRCRNCLRHLIPVPLKRNHLPFTPGNLDDRAAVVFLVLVFTDWDRLDSAVGAGGDTPKQVNVISFTFAIELR